MLMKTRIEPVDFHQVDDTQAAMHHRLENWARYVAFRRMAWQGPIWRMGRSHGRQWHQPDIRASVDTLDGHAMEKAVSALPEKHRDAIRWHYVFRTTPASAARQIGVTYEVLAALVRSGRSMLINRDRK